MAETSVLQLNMEEQDSLLYPRHPARTLSRVVKDTCIGRHPSPPSPAPLPR